MTPHLHGYVHDDGSITLELIGAASIDEAADLLEDPEVIAEVRAVWIAAQWREVQP